MLRLEIETFCPAINPFAAWNVTTFEAIVNPVIVATVLQLATPHAPNGGAMLVTRVSGELFPPVEIVFVVVLTSAIEPASQMLT